MPLTNDGLATFQGAAARGTTRFVGVGDGAVSIDWRLDPATVRSWPAPRRGAL